jgi:membrane protein implicated in regulation of membrane protease activity
MKEFGIYTGLRAVLFALSLGVLWLALHSTLSIWLIALFALVVSSILSIFVLRAARDRLALQIEHRAERMTQRIQQARSAEDDD